MVIPIFSFVFFALYERKKDKHMIEKYHAAGILSMSKGRQKRIFVTPNGSTA